MEVKEYDFVIVGMGLAGITLSDHLLAMGKKVLAFDSEQANSSSKVAAGLYNPITGRKMNKTWLADKLFPYLQSYYHTRQKNASTTFFFPNVIYRPFISLEEQNEWSGKSAMEEYMPYLHQIHYQSQYDFCFDRYGGIELQNAGYLNVTLFIDMMMKQFSKDENFHFVSSAMEPNKIVINEYGGSYEGVTFSKIIFCNGATILKDGYFDWVPLRPVKGEILTIKMNIAVEKIINRGVFIMPLGNDTFKVGSTYDHTDLTTRPTEKGRQQIEEKLKGLIHVNYEVIHHEAGVRPATKDRKPLIGMHPKYKNVGIFNGLGTKGVSLAPYFANQFAQHLVNQVALDKEINIERFEADYQK